MGENKQKRPLWFRLLRGIVITLLALVLLVAGVAWWLLGTASGATWLVNTALPYAQEHMPEELQLDIRGVEADTLANISVARVALTDGEGVWLEADGLTLRWTPAALWEMTFDAQEISAKRIRFLRPPLAEETPQQPLKEQIEATQQTLRQLPDMLRDISLPPVRIEKLQVDELALEMVPIRLKLLGTADLARLPAALDVRVDSLEGAETHASASLKGNMETAKLELLWNEATGGMLGKMLPLAVPAPLEASLKADMQHGKLAHALSLKAGETTLLDGKFDLPLAEDAPISATLTLQNPTLLAPLANQQQPITMSADLQGNVLRANVATAAYALGEGQSLSELAAETRLTFEDDPLFALEANAEAILNQPEAEPMPLQIALAATGDAEEWQIEKLSASAPEMLVEAKGSFGLQDGKAELSGEAILPQLDAGFVVEATELWVSPQASAELVLKTLKQPLPAPLDKVLILPLTLTAETQTIDAPLPDIALTLASKNLNGDGMIHPNAQAEDTLAEVKLQVDGLPVPLQLAADYSAAGVGAVEAKSKNLVASTHYALGEQNVTFSKLRVNAPQSIELAGEISVNTQSSLAQGAIKGHVKSTKPLQELGLAVPLVQMEKGALTLKLDAPKNVQTAELNLDSGDVKLDGAPLGESIVLQSHVALPADAAPQMRAQLAARNIASPIVIDEAKLTVDSDEEAWNWKLSAKMPEAHLDSAGTLSLADEIVLTIAQLTSGWGKENILTATAPMQLLYSEEKIALRDAKLTLNDSATLDATATLTDDEVQGIVKIDKLPLRTLPVAALQAAQGDLTIRLNLSGAADNPYVKLGVNLDELQQNYPQMARLRDQPLMVKLRGEVQNGEASAQLSANAPDAESFAAANISMPLRLSLAPKALSVAPGERFNAALKADLLLAPFMPLLLPDGVYGDGHLTADIRANGPFDNPNLQGDVALSKARVEVLQAGTTIEELQAKVQARGNTITISDGSATDGDKGTLAFGGTLTLDETLPMDFTAKVAQFVALRHPTATATLSGDTRLNGDLSDALLKGDWQINGAKITITPSNGSSVTEMEVVEVDSLDAPLAEQQEVVEMTEEQREAARAERRKNRPFARNLKLEMAISAENQIFLDGFGLNAELKGAVNVNGTAARPALGGKMETVRGRWEFFGRTFNITRGEAQLSENNLSAPLINLRAEADADDVLAIAQITGTTDNPKIEFSSIPALPRDEVLSRVMFGENLNNISPYQALQLADMLRSLSGSGDGTSLNPLSKLQDTLGIDELKINNDSGNNEDVTVGVGKYLQEGVYLEVEGGAGQDSGKVSVEVDLTPNISVETEARQTADTAVRLNYKYDY